MTKLYKFVAHKYIMPKISNRKEDKIKESILLYLFQNFPRALFTSAISEELARDEEYIKRLLLELEAKKLVASLRKNPKGKELKRRMRWHLSPAAYESYKSMQNTQNKLYLDDLDFE
jgi:hypothetical protein